MSQHILPPDFDERAAAAVQHFWTSREVRPAPAQDGSRGAVIGGKNMDGFLSLVVGVATFCGLPSGSVLTRKAAVVLPGYFRATKNWDVLVVHEGRLLAVFEFKSQVGSFGNNFNNRSEEVIGAAADLWVAQYHGAYRPRGAPTLLGTQVVREPDPLLNPRLQADPRPPFLGWLMLLEDTAASRRPVEVDEPHFPVFPEFRGASYATRYQILCERLVERQLYAAAALVLSDSDGGRRAGAHQSLSEATSLRRLFAAFAGRILGDLTA
jgi:hypothetical protein